MESIEKNEFVSVSKRKKEEIKDKRMNIRISERDLKNLKIRAL
jgi:predicted DNA binding CopG/RHH family protein